MFTPTSLVDRFLHLIESAKPSDRIILRTLFFVVVGTGTYFLLSLNDSHLVTTPTRGGTLIEGIVGIPRFVNPALAITRADQDVVALVYSGLMKMNVEGRLEPDIAEAIETSEDGLQYLVTLKRDRSFHDGTPITARDVVFTINLIRDPDLKSPFRGNWSDVTITEIDEYTFTVTLKEPYAPFIENFTFGVMPHHIWSNLPIEQLPFSQYNTEPIGSGPFTITEVNRDAAGLISSYLLKPMAQGGESANLAAIQLKFFQNETSLEEALKNKLINSTVYLPNDRVSEFATDDYTIITRPLPRIFAIFINQNRSAALRDKSARQALNAAIDREALVTDILHGYGVPTTAPVVPAHRTLLLEDTGPETTSTSSPTEIATDILVRGGWKKNDAGLWEKRIDQDPEVLAVTIRTANGDVFNETASFVADSWRALGIEVQIEQYEQTGLVQSVIRARDFETLLFGLDMNRLQELYPFWHSSQKDDPGLNISQYTNIKVDTLLEKSRTVMTEEEQVALLKEVSQIIADELPAIFLYAPSITYVIDHDIEPAPLLMLGKPADRFMNITKWHARTDTVWKFFTRPETDK